MKKRSQRLKVVLDLADRRKRDAEKYLAEHVQRVENDKVQLLQLEQYLNQYEVEFAAVVRRGASIEQVQNYQAFIAKISATIAKHKKAMEINKEQLEQVRQYWNKLYATHSAMGSLVDKAVDKEQKEMDKALQKSLDDRYQRVHSNPF